MRDKQPFKILIINSSDIVIRMILSYFELSRSVLCGYIGEECGFSKCRLDTNNCVQVQGQLSRFRRNTVVYIARLVIPTPYTYTCLNLLPFIYRCRIHTYIHDEVSILFMVIY